MFDKNCLPQAFAECLRVFFFLFFFLVVNVVVFVIVFEKKVLVSKIEMLKGKILVDNNIKILCDQVSRFSNNLTKLME